VKELRDVLNSFFLNLPAKPFFAARKTDPENLRELLRALAPVLTDRPLIRMGPRGDGGYLVPDDLDGISTCFSPGVSMVSGFEMECASRGMDVFLADASVEAPPDSHPQFSFSKKFIGAYPHGEFISMEQWIESSNPDPLTDWLYQIDIEGSEYEVIINLPEHYLKKFRVIIIEFHALDHLFDDAFFRLANCAFRKILNHFSCVHIHPNNSASVVGSDGIVIPKIMEFTFYRNDRIRSKTPAISFPHPLDNECVEHFPPLTLHPCWHTR
jgi:hypothetical protein